MMGKSLKKQLDEFPEDGSEGILAEQRAIVEAAQMANRSDLWLSGPLANVLRL